MARANYLCDYCIEKLTHHGWVRAWGSNSRTYVDASNNLEAIGIFKRETSRIKTVPHRLINWRTSSYIVIACLGADELQARREASCLLGVLSDAPFAPRRKRI